MHIPDGLNSGLDNYLQSYKWIEGSGLTIINQDLLALVAIKVDIYS